MAELDIEQIIAEATPVEAEVKICVKGDLNLKHEELVARLTGASVNGDLQRLADEIGEVEEQMRAAEHTFHLRRLPPDEFDTLRKPFLRAGTPYIDPDKMAEFTVPLIAASVTSPAMTAEQAQRLLAQLNAGQRDVLFDKALAVNIGTVNVPFSLAASKIRGQPTSSGNSKQPAQ